MKRNEINRGPRDVIWPVVDVYAAEGTLSNVSSHAYELMGRHHCASMLSGVATCDKYIGATAQ